MPTVGQTLRLERESRGLKRVDVARVIKVAAHHLAALEHDDFDALPEEVFAKGFVRTYAGHLGLDPEVTVADFVRELRARRPPPPESTEVVRTMARILNAQEDARTNGRGRSLVLAAGATLVVLALAAAWWLSSDRARRPEPAAEPLIARAEPRATAPATGPATPVEPVASAAQEAQNGAAPAQQLAVPEHAVGTGIEQRRIVGESESFAAGTTVWFWTRVEGGAAGEVVRHIWLHEGRRIHAVDLELGGWHWRTYSRMTLPSTGSWVVEARDREGQLLAAREFACTPEPGR